MKRMFTFTFFAVFCSLYTLGQNPFPCDRDEFYIVFPGDYKEVIASQSNREDAANQYYAGYFDDKTNTQFSATWLKYSRLYSEKIDYNTYGLGEYLFEIDSSDNQVPVKSKLEYSKDFSKGGFEGKEQKFTYRDKGLYHITAVKKNIVLCIIVAGTESPVLKSSAAKFFSSFKPK